VPRSPIRRKAGGCWRRPEWRSLKAAPAAAWFDQSFVKRIAAQEDCRMIVHAAIGWGRSLHMSASPQGVETEAQLEALRSEPNFAMFSDQVIAVARFRANAQSCNMTEYP
jgi:hypothetical protein